MLNITLCGRETVLFFPRLDIMEALRAILTHEKIPFSVGLGPSTSVILVDVDYGEKLRTVLQNWRRATKDMFAGSSHRMWEIIGKQNG
jgi:hypothetical protein